MILYSVHDFCRQFGVDAAHASATLFERIWRRDGRGLVVVFENEKLRDFCPFVDKNWTNSWWREVRIENGLSPMQIAAKCCAESGFKFRPEKMWHDLRRWRRNGHLIRGDRSLPRHMYDLEPWLRKLTGVPEGKFFMFINAQDFPRANVFNMCDVVSGNLIPTWDDLRQVPAPHNICWSDRPSRAIWRGSNTGINGMREKLVSMNDGDLVDAQFSKWQSRLICIDKTITFKRPPTGAALSPFLTLNEQAARAKYAICIDGNVAAFRLRDLFCAEFVVLLVESKWKLWYSDQLVPHKHFVPVSSNLDNLTSQIEWLRQNDETARQIAANGRRFFEQNLAPEHVEKFFVRQLTRCSFGATTRNDFCTKNCDLK